MKLFFHGRKNMYKDIVKEIEKKTIKNNEGSETNEGNLSKLRKEIQFI